MKVYTLTDLKRIAKEQNYLTAALENTEGKRLLGFNQPRVKKIDKQLEDIAKRLTGEILPNGYYNVLMSLAVNKQKTPDVYLITKGEINQDVKPNIIPLQETKKEVDVLTWSEALKLHSELAELREENKSLKDKIIDLEDTIEDLEDQLETGLSEVPGANENNLGSLLKEHAPTLMAIADKFFNLEERKLNIKEKEISFKINPANPNPFKKPEPKKIIPGTKEHLALIEMYLKNGNEDQMLFELQKLAEVNQDLYNEVINKINETRE